MWEQSMAMQRRRGRAAATPAHRLRAGVWGKLNNSHFFPWWQEDTGRGGELQDAPLADIQPLHTPTNKSLNSPRFCLHVVIYICIDTEELLVESTRFTNLLLSRTVHGDCIAQTCFSFLNIKYISLWNSCPFSKLCRLKPSQVERTNRRRVSTS